MKKVVKNFTIAAFTVLASPNLLASETSVFKGGLIASSGQERAPYSDVEGAIDVDGIGFHGTYTHYFKDLRNERRPFLADFKLHAPYIQVGFIHSGQDGTSDFLVQGDTVFETYDLSIGADVVNNTFSLAGGTWLDNGLGIEASFSNEKSSNDYKSTLVSFEFDSISTDESERSIEIKPSYFFSKTQQVGLIFESIKMDGEDQTSFGVTTQNVLNDTYVVKGSLVTGSLKLDLTETDQLELDLFMYELGGGYISKKFGFYATATMGTLDPKGSVFNSIGDFKVTIFNFTQLYSISKDLHFGIELTRTSYSDGVGLGDEHQYLGYLNYWF